MASLLAPDHVGSAIVPVFMKLLNDPVAYVRGLSTKAVRLFFIQSAFRLTGTPSFLLFLLD